MSKIPITKEERIKIAKKFAEKVVEKYKDLVVSVVLFGSVVREEFKPTSDIDVFVIIDDTKEEFSKELLEQFDADIERIAESIEDAKIKFRDPITGKERVVNLLSVQPTYLLTEFWDYARIGHPIIYNFIKEGIALYDVGVFKPIQRLWKLGKIPTTREAIEKYLEDAPKKIARAKTVKLLQLAEDCYYAIVNSAQAILMFLGKQPPVPSKLYNEIRKTLVEPGILEPEYANWIKEIVDIRKKIEHQELKDVKGDFVDMWLDRAEKFVRKMLSLLGALEIRKMEKIVMKTNEVLYKAVIETLDKLNVPIDEQLKEILKIRSSEKFRELRKQIDEEKIRQIKEAFKEKLVVPGYVDSAYLKVWDRVEELRDLVEKKRFDDLDFGEVYEMREAVRLLIRELSKAWKRLGIEDKEEKG